ncbi:hypothetical protein WA158_000334 [Blastocystis sp. Blastoise]
MLGSNNRVSSIQKYNERIAAWNEKDRSSFAKSSFSLTTDFSSYSFDSITLSSGTNWPVRDSCKLEDDPSEGCIETKPQYYQVDVSYSKVSSVLIKNNGNNIVDRSPSRSKTFYYTPKDLGCDTDGSVSCYTACSRKNGYWDGDLCAITGYLYKACYRLISKGDTYRTDSPATLPLQGVQDIGCEYHNGGWDPEYYSTSRPVSITFMLRYYDDPFIVASDLTNGCSSSTTSASQCFGLTKKQQTYLGGIIFVVSLIGLAIEGGVIALMIFCCKKNPFNCFSKKHSSLPANYGQNVQYTTPMVVAYPPVATNAYGQPIYAQPV